MPKKNNDLIVWSFSDSAEDDCQLHSLCRYEGYDKNISEFINLLSSSVFDYFYGDDRTFSEVVEESHIVYLYRESETTKTLSPMGSATLDFEINQTAEVNLDLDGEE